MKRSLNFRGRPGKHLTPANLASLMKRYGVEKEKCRVCDAEIETAELCATCADGNDPFPATSKHRPER
jgi:hypothetical protein